MKTLKTAVVGLGRIGWHTHIPQILQRSDRFSLAAVVDVSTDRLVEAKNIYGVKGYTDITNMIHGEKPDLVVIASPTHLHCEHACTAMRLGCDVFLDKPMAVDYDTACVIAKCAEQTGRKLMVYQPHRASAPVNQLMKIVNSGKIGKLCSIHATRNSYVRRSDWQAFRKFGGGMLNNYGAHYIDALIYMANDKVRRLYCSTDTVASAGDADDVVKIIFRTERGITLDININQAATLSGPDWLVYGQYGAIISESTPDGNMQFHLRWFDPNAVPAASASESLAAANRSYNNDIPLPWNEEIIPLDSDCAIAFYDKVYEYFAKEKEPFVPIGETLYVMQLIAQCRENAAQ